MNINLKWVMEAIRNLTNVTVERGATEAEAMAAATKVEELIKNYNVTIDKVFLGENPCVQDRVDGGGLRKRPIQYCVCAIAKFCDCKCWFEHGVNKGLEYRPGNYVFFGMETDVMMAKYLYSIIDTAVDTETSTFQRTPTYRNTTVHGKTLITSFQKGMVFRVSKRLEEMADARKAGENKPLAGTGTSLVVVKNQKVETEFALISEGFRNVQATKSRIHKGALEAGKAAGDRVNINRPLAGNTAGLLT